MPFNFSALLLKLLASLPCCCCCCCKMRRACSKAQLQCLPFSTLTPMHYIQLLKSWLLQLLPRSLRLLPRWCLLRLLILQLSHPLDSSAAILKSGALKQLVVAATFRRIEVLVAIDTLPANIAQEGAAAGIGAPETEATCCGLWISRIVAKFLKGCGVSWQLSHVGKNTKLVGGEKVRQNSVTTMSMQLVYRCRSTYPALNPSEGSHAKGGPRVVGKASMLGLHSNSATHCIHIAQPPLQVRKKPSTHVSLLHS